MRKHLVLLALFLLAASGAVRAQANSLPSRALHGEDGQTATEGQAAPQSNVALDRGALQFKRGPGLVMTVMRMRLRLADGTAVAGELEPDGQETGSDEAGRYERLRFRLKPNASAPRSGVGAALEVRRYLPSEALVAWLDYDGPPLAAREGVQLVMSLDRFARGMAIKRFKLYWTAPVFFSDYRFLGPANQLMLWRQTEGEDYHLLAPLAGGGMVGEVGVSEIDYRFEFRVTASSYDAKLSPRRVPLFVYTAGADAHALPRGAYETAFAATNQYGRLRWQKGYPEVFRSLGWCSWNAYESSVTAEKVLASVRSLRDKRIPFGFVLVDDGWLSVKDRKLTGFDADPAKFPGGMAALARVLRADYGVPHVGVWHTFQGYWLGVDEASEVGRAHALFKGLDGNSLPDPRDGRGESFYADWFGRLKGWGYDFVKVDGQGNNIKFTDGLMPLFDSGNGSHRNLQQAAQKFFSDGARADQGDGLGVINCMEMSLENAFNWRLSNVARNSDDYLPEIAHNAKDHVYQNAYNAYWMANFAYPDWDMFQSHDARAEYHAAARAVSGGPVYITDEPGKERPEVVRPLAFSDGRLLMPDAPGQVTRDLLLRDPTVEPTALKVFAPVSRPGLSATVVATFHVNKGAARVAGVLWAADAGAGREGGGVVAVYQRSTGRALLLDEGRQSLDFSLADFGFDLFTIVSLERGAAVFGLLDKYLGPAGVSSVTSDPRGLTVRLREAGEFGAWLTRPPAGVVIDGRALPSAEYSYDRGLLRVPAASFGDRGGERELRILIAPGRR